MNPELIIVRYGEIGLKADYTRKQFENVLIKNIKNALNAQNISANIKKIRGRIYVYTDQIELSCKILKKIFGITSISPAIGTTSDIGAMEKLSLTIADEKISKNKSFALKVTRDGNHDYTSRDVAVKLGNVIVKKTSAPVDLTNPDFKLHIEIKNEKSYFYFEKIQGIGGLPLGTQGNVLAIIDNEESILAAWYLMKRGCNTIFALTNKSLSGLVERFTEEWNASNKIHDVKKKDSDQLKKIISKYGCNAIVTGLSIDEIDGISNIKKDANISVLTPLISMDKKEIESKSRMIGLTK